jgi:putative glycerol-1-phosphate prenyltransferase
LWKWGNKSALTVQKKRYFYGPMQKKNTLYKQVLDYKSSNRKLLAILLDPDKIDWRDLSNLCVKINQSPATHVFIGGSVVTSDRIDELVQTVKRLCRVPVLLFPGNPSQISEQADGILFLSLLSGRNPDFLIGHQVAAAPRLVKSSLEVLPTGYLLIDGGNETAVARVSQTKPMQRVDMDLVVATAQAAELLGNKLIYLEAGSGALQAVPLEMIEAVAQNINIPLIVGGGIKTLKGIEQAYAAGADVIVIGTAFENDLNFFNNTAQ